VYATFIGIEHRQIYLPYHLAATFAGSFFQGLITRLVLENYKGALQLPSNKLMLVPAPQVHPAPPAHAAPAPAPLRDANVWIQTYLDGLGMLKTGRVFDPNSWKGDYCNRTYALTDSLLPFAGMLDGWLTGDYIVQQTQGDINNTILPALRALIKTRYTIDFLGSIVGYTLFYLGGFVNNERTGAAIAGTPGASVDTLAGVLDAYSGHLLQIGQIPTTSAAGMFQLAQQFYDVVSLDYFKFAQTQGAGAGALANYYWFLEGYIRGLTSGATAMMSLMYRLGYQDGYDAGYVAGYQVGFSVGLSTGYAEGYSVGWQAGYGTGYSDGQGSFADIVSGIAGALQTASSDLGTISTIINVGSAIGSLL
jgi:hypothetical protein